MSDTTGAPTPSAPTSSAPSTPAAAPKAAAPTPSKTPAPATGVPSGTAANVTGASTSTTTPDSKHADPPTDAAKTEAAAKAAERRKYQLKVDGQQISEELTDDEIAVRLQKAHAAEKRMAEAAKLRKETEAALEYVRKDPFAALKEAFGIDLDTLAEQRLAERYQEQLLSPVEQEKLKLQRELDAQKRQLQEFQQKQEAEARAALDKQVFQQMEQEWKAVMQEVDFPADKYTMRMYAEIASGYLQQGIELSPKQIAGEIRKRMDTYNKGVLKQLKGDTLISYLGDDVVKEILKHSVSKIQSASKLDAQAPVATQSGDAGADKPERKPNDPRAFRKMIRGF